MKRLSLWWVDLSVKSGIQHPWWNKLIFVDPPCCAKNATLASVLQLLNVLDDVKRVLSASLKFSFYFPLISLEEVTSIASGNCCCLYRLVDLNDFVKKSGKKTFSNLWKCACVSPLYGQNWSCSPQKPLQTMNPESRCLLKHDCDRKCSTCLTALQLSKRWGRFREEPSQSWGLVLMLAGQLSGDCPESTTHYGRASGHEDSSDGTSQIHRESQIQVKLKTNN